MENHDPIAHYIILKETPYYTSAPAQGRPADGTLQKGTPVSILEVMSGYVKIQTEDETITGFVEADAVGPLTDY